MNRPVLLSAKRKVFCSVASVVLNSHVSEHTETPVLFGGHDDGYDLFPWLDSLSRWVAKTPSLSVIQVALPFTTGEARHWLEAAYSPEFCPFDMDLDVPEFLTWDHFSKSCIHRYLPHDFCDKALFYWRTAVSQQPTESCLDYFIRDCYVRSMIRRVDSSKCPSPTEIKHNYVLGLQDRELCSRLITDESLSMPEMLSMAMEWEEKKRLESFRLSRRARRRLCQEQNTCFQCGMYDHHYRQCTVGEAPRAEMLEILRKRSEGQANAKRKWLERRRLRESDGIAESCTMSLHKLFSIRASEVFATLASTDTPLPSPSSIALFQGSAPNSPQTATFQGSPVSTPRSACSAHSTLRLMSEPVESFVSQECVF